MSTVTVNPVLRGRVYFTWINSFNTHNALWGRYYVILFSRWETEAKIGAEKVFSHEAVPKACSRPLCCTTFMTETKRLTWYSYGGGTEGNCWWIGSKDWGDGRNEWALHSFLLDQSVRETCLLLVVQRKEKVEEEQYELQMKSWHWRCLWRCLGGQQLGRSVGSWM